MSATKSSYLQLRVTPQQKQLIQNAARQADMDMSAWILARVFVPSRQRLEDYLQALQEDQADPKKRGFAFAAIDDLFESLSAEAFSQVVAAAPAAGLQPFASNYFAAMVEMTCHRKGVPAPLWAAHIQPLREPYFGVSLQSLRLHLLLHSPPPFRRRNIFIDTGTGGRV